MHRFTLAAFCAVHLSFTAFADSVTARYCYDEGTENSRHKRFFAEIEWGDEVAEEGLTYWIVTEDSGDVIWPQLSGELGAWGEDDDATLVISAGFPLKIYVASFTPEAKRRFENARENSISYIEDDPGVKRVSNSCRLKTNGVSGSSCGC